MFNKLKQFKDLRHQANDLQRQLAAEIVTVERRGITLVMDGNQRVTSLVIPPAATAAEIEQTLPGVFNDAVKQIQQRLSQKMQAGEITMPNL